MFESLEKLSAFLAKPVANILQSSPFSAWSFERWVEDERQRIYYSSKENGLELMCNADEALRTMFVHADRFDEAQFAIEFSSSRADVLNKLGRLSKSREGHADPILGVFGPFDRFSSQGYEMHVEYRAHSDCIKMITLMCSESAP